MKNYEPGPDTSEDIMDWPQRGLLPSLFLIKKIINRYDLSIYLEIKIII